MSSKPPAAGQSTLPSAAPPAGSNDPSGTAASAASAHPARLDLHQIAADDDGALVVLARAGAPHRVGDAGIVAGHEVGEHEQLHMGSGAAVTFTSPFSSTTPPALNSCTRTRPRGSARPSSAMRVAMSYWLSAKNCSVIAASGGGPQASTCVAKPWTQAV